MRVLERGNPAPFSFQRGTTGCLLLHGFPGAPAEMRLLGEYLAARQITVHAPVLPGMGTVPEDLRGVSWRDWVATAEEALSALGKSCPTVFLCGLSMGGALSLYLAARHPVRGVAALAPAIRLRDRRLEWAWLLHWLQPWVEPSDAPDDLADPGARALTWHYQRYPSSAGVQMVGLVRATRRSLSQVRCPVLVVQGPRDAPLHPEGARWAVEQMAADDKTLVWLERSGHNIAVDAEREEVFGHVYRFITRLAGVASGRGGEPAA
jgi:carboxylesterase